MFIHGFGGSGVLFYEMMAPLAEHFHAHFIDIIGMGNSSRAPYQVEGAEASLDYFMSFIESWRESRGLTNFFLAAHSLGGYLASNYYIRYAHHIKKLFLVSPIGFMKKPENFDISRLQVVKLLDANGKKVPNKGPPGYALRKVWPYAF